MIDLILLESVPGLGRPGDSVRVKPGYARNYLLPKRKAAPPTQDILRGLAKLKQKAEEEEREAIANFTELAEKLNGFRVVINARATEEGHLFGSVTERDIQDSLEASGWQIPPRSVRLETHVKEAGETEAEIHLYADISTKVVLEVIPVDAEGQPIEILEAEEPTETPDESGDDEVRSAPAEADI